MSPSLLSAIITRHGCTDRGCLSGRTFGTCSWSGRLTQLFGHAAENAIETVRKLLVQVMKICSVTGWNRLKLKDSEI